MGRLRAIVELLLLIPAGVIGALLTGLVAHLVHADDPRWFNVLTSFGVGTASLLLVLLLMRRDGHRARSIGWTADNLSGNIFVGVGAYMVTFALMLLTTAVLYLVFPHLFEEPTRAQRAIEETFPPMKPAWLLPMMLFVAIWEEIVFRGFLLTRLYALLPRWWAAVPAGAMIFGVAHAYEGPVAILMVGGLAVVLGALLIWRKSLVPGIVFHLIHNVLMLLLLQKVV